MLKKAVKILSVIVIMWLVSLLTIVKEYKTNNKVVLGGKDHMYEQALEKFRKKFDNGSSEFRGKNLADIESCCYNSSAFIMVFGAM